MVAAGGEGDSLPIQAERDEGTSLSPLLLFIQYEMTAAHSGRLPPPLALCENALRHSQSWPHQCPRSFLIQSSLLLKLASSHRKGHLQMVAETEPWPLCLGNVQSTLLVLKEAPRLLPEAQTQHLTALCHKRASWGHLLYSNSSLGCYSLSLISGLDSHQGWMDSRILTKAGVVWTKRASLEAHTSLTWGIHGTCQGPANTSPALLCKLRQWCPAKGSDRLGAQLRHGHIRTQVTSRTYRFCLTGQGPHSSDFSIQQGWEAPGQAVVLRALPGPAPALPESCLCTERCPSPEIQEG